MGPNFLPVGFKFGVMLRAKATPVVPAKQANGCNVGDYFAAVNGGTCLTPPVSAPPVITSATGMKSWCQSTTGRPNATTTRPIMYQYITGTGPTTTLQPPFLSYHSWKPNLYWTQYSLSQGIGFTSRAASEAKYGVSMIACEYPTK